MATTFLARSTPLRTLLQINVAFLTALSGGIFAFAEGGPIAAFTIPIALCALIWNDIKGTFSLSLWMANGLGLLAFWIAGMEFFGESIEGRLLGFGHLLFYLSWILLWQKKESRQFWWLCALSVLQVATSSVLTNSIFLGLLLIAYVLFALWTLSVFSLDRAVTRSIGGDLSTTSPATEQPSTSNKQSASRNGVRSESLSGWISPRFVTGVIVNGILSILVGLAFFVLTPRVWIGNPLFLRNESTAAVRSTTGFSEDVSVGDMGEILENHDLVLEATFTNLLNSEPIDAYEYASRLGYDAPLFRGAVLGVYENGRWRPVPSDYRLAQPASHRVLDRNDALVQQKVRIRSIGTRTLFSCGPTVTCLPVERRGSYETEHELLSNTFRRRPRLPDQDETAENFDYYAFSYEDDRRLPSKVYAASVREYVNFLTKVPSGLRPLSELAIQTTSTREGTSLSSADAVNQLVRLLRDSGEYKYSLNLSIQDPTIDPVVDFVMNRKEGHCEYFASALVLMLRSVGIPARYVSGFKGGTLNEDTGSIEIRQLHTHAWVEAYVDRQWIVLDPTPAARDQAVSEISDTSHFWTDLAARSQELWVSGLTLSGDQQRRLFLAPLRDSTSGLFDSFQAFADRWTSQTSGSGSADGSARSSIGQILVTLTSAVVLLICCVWLMKRVPGSLGRRFSKRRSRASQKTQTVAFYERFREILARKGHQRRDSQTPQEFAIDLDDQLQQLGARNGISDIPHTLTRAFYEVRFGQHVLPPQQLLELNSSLDELEQSLANNDSPSQP